GGGPGGCGGGQRPRLLLWWLRRPTRLLRWRRRRGHRLADVRTEAVQVHVSGVDLARRGRLLVPPGVLRRLPEVLEHRGRAAHRGVVLVRRRMLVRALVVPLEADVHAVPAPGGRQRTG